MTFTKEQLQHIIETDHVQCGEASALARMALAVMEAEPVAWHIHIPLTDCVYVEVDSETVGRVRAGCEKHNHAVNITPLYDGPQPLTTSERAELENYRNAQQVVTEQINSITAVEPDWSDPTNREPGIWAYGWNECRTAMQGKAETVIQPSTLRDGVEALRTSGIAIDSGKIHAERAALNEPVCWCRTCRPVSAFNVLFIVCPECGNKRCPHANDHRNVCTGSNEPGQEGSAYPAAPQQEVKS